MRASGIGWPARAGGGAGALRAARALALLLTSWLLAGCAALHEKQGEWIFQPSVRDWGSAAATDTEVQETWIAFTSPRSGQPVQLHALWFPADASGAGGAERAAQAPVLLYLHGARWNVTGSTARIRRMQALGFAVLAPDYRGFGRSDRGPPTEASAYEDALAAWQWLAERHPQRPRYLFGHSLGGAIAIHVASQVTDEAGVMVEGTFTSIPDVVRDMPWGWLPVAPLITQRFASIDKVERIGSPLLVVHGSEDTLVRPALGRRLYDAAREPKAFVLVEGGSHHSTHALGQAQYREAITRLFGLP